MQQRINFGESYTLSEIASTIKDTLNLAFAEAYWIKAEIAKLNYYPHSGHCFPDLVEKEEKTIKAQIRATIWARVYRMIQIKFRDVTNENLKDGMQVMILAEINFHEVYGLSLNIIDIEPSFTLGELAKEKKETIKKLKEEGIFDKNKQVPMPVLPKRIAVISVETSKGYSDFVATLNANHRGYRFDWLLFPSVLEGERCITSMMEQLERIKKVSTHFDLVTIIRGGGGEVGLSCYDNWEFARNIALYPIPVLTGIGHSTNETVVEMVAHSNKITPTEVAYFLIQQFYEFDSRVGEMQETILLDVQNILKIENERIMDLSRVVHNNTMQLLAKEQNELRNLTRFLVSYSRQFLKNSHNEILNINDKIKILDPKQVLKRGYSITMKDGKPVTKADEAEVEDIIQTKLYSGSLTSKVQSKKKRS